MKLIHPRLPVFLAGVVAGVVLTFGGLHAAAAHGPNAAWIAARAFAGAMFCWLFVLSQTSPK